MMFSFWKNRQRSTLMAGKGLRNGECGFAPTRRTSVPAKIARVAAAAIVSCLALLLLNSMHARETAGVRPGEWLRDGIVASSDMEALTFILRRGGEPQDAIEEWHQQRSEAAVRKLKEAGVNLAIINFYKGAGLKAEGEDIEAARKFVALAHKYGIKVAGYVGATMMYETLFQEEPEARNWRQVNEFGEPIYYTSDQTFRYMACRNNPGYRAFIRKVLRIGVQDVKLDVIHFDQMMWWPEPHSCRCSYCQAQFREFLENRYGDPQRARLRFGFTSFAGVIPPPYGIHEPPVRLPELHNPMMQEWANFRAWSLARDFKEFSDYIHELNPNVAVIANPSANLETNVGYIYGVDPQQLYATVDGIWTEEPNLPEWTSDGRLVSQIRTYKSARTMGRPLFHWEGLRGYAEYAKTSPSLRLAESLAYDDANLGVIAGGDVEKDGPSETVRRYVNFFHSNLKYLAHTKEIADVAILRSFPSTQFNPSQSNFDTVLFEQSLIQSKIPFSIIFDRQLSELAHYKVLVLANQDALSDEQIDLIRKFVEKGGGLVATGNTSLLTEWRTRRQKFGLSDVLGMGLPPGDSSANQPIERPFGRGRVAYIPRIDPAMPAPAPQMNYSVGNAYWKLPKNDADLLSAVQWAAGGDFSATVDAPLWVTAELSQQENSPMWLLHLVNFKVNEPVELVKIRVHLPGALRSNRVTLLDPDKPTPETIEATTDQNVVTVTVPRLNTYCLLLFKMGKD